MSVIIRLQGLPWSASAMNIRHFFSGLSIPAGGVHIIGGDGGDAFIAFSSDDDARMAMKKNMCCLNDTPIQLFLSSKAEMQSVIDAARSGVSSQAVSTQQAASGVTADTPPGMAGPAQAGMQMSNFPPPNMTMAGMDVHSKPNVQQSSGGGNDFGSQMQPNQWQGFHGGTGAGDGADKSRQNTMIGQPQQHGMGGYPDGGDNQFGNRGYNKQGMDIGDTLMDHQARGMGFGPMMGQRTGHTNQGQSSTEGQMDQGIDAQRSMNQGPMGYGNMNQQGGPRNQDFVNQYHVGGPRPMGVNQGEIRGHMQGNMPGRPPFNQNMSMEQNQGGHASAVGRQGIGGDIFPSGMSQPNLPDNRGPDSRMGVHKPSVSMDRMGNQFSGDPGAIRDFEKGRAAMPWANTTMQGPHMSRNQFPGNMNFDRAKEDMQNPNALSSHDAMSRPSLGPGSLYGSNRRPGMPPNQFPEKMDEESLPSTSYPPDEPSMDPESEIRMQSRFPHMHSFNRDEKSMSGSNFSAGDRLMAKGIDEEKERFSDHNRRFNLEAHPGRKFPGGENRMRPDTGEGMGSFGPSGSRFPPGNHAALDDQYFGRRPNDASGDNRYRDRETFERRRPDDPWDRRPGPGNSGENRERFLPGVPPGDRRDFRSAAGVESMWGNARESGRRGPSRWDTAKEDVSEPAPPSKTSLENSNSKPEGNNSEETVVDKDQRTGSMERGNTDPLVKANTMEKPNASGIDINAAESGTVLRASSLGNNASRLEARVSVERKGEPFEDQGPRFQGRRPGFNNGGPGSEFEDRNAAFEGQGTSNENRRPEFEREVFGFEGRPGFEGRDPGFEGRGPGFERRGPGFEGRGPGFEGRGPGFEGRGPGFDGRGPGFEGRGPGFEGRGSGFEGRGPGFEGRGPGFEGRGPGFEGRGPGFEGRGPGFEGRGPGFEGRGRGFEGRGPGFEGFEGRALGFDGRDPGFEGRGPGFERRRPDFEGRREEMGPENRRAEFEHFEDMDIEGREKAGMDSQGRQEFERRMRFEGRQGRYGFEEGVGPSFEGRGSRFESHGPSFEGRRGPGFEGMHELDVDRRENPDFDGREEPEASRIRGAGYGRGGPGMRGRGSDVMRGRGGPGTEMARGRGFSDEPFGRDRALHAPYGDSEMEDFDNRIPGRGGPMFDRPFRGRGDPFFRGRGGPPGPYGRGRGMDRFEDASPRDVDARNMGGHPDVPRVPPHMKSLQGNTLQGENSSEERGTSNREDGDDRKRDQQRPDTASRRDADNKGVRRSYDRDRESDRERRYDDRRGRDRDDRRYEDRSRYRFSRDRYRRSRSRSRDRSRDKDRYSSSGKSGSPRTKVDTLGRSLCVKNMPLTANYKEIRRFFQPFDIPFDGLKIINDEKGNRTGVAYVQLRRADDIQKALRRNGDKIESNTVNVTICSDEEFSKAVDSYVPSTDQSATDVADIKLPPSQGKDKPVNPDKIRYILQMKNLPQSITKQDILQFFKGVTVENNGQAAYIEFDQSGVATGIGFVEVKADIDYKKGLTFDGSKIGINAIRVLPGKTDEADDLKGKQMEMLQRAALRNASGPKVTGPGAHLARPGLMGPRPGVPPQQTQPQTQMPSPSQVRPPQTASVTNPKPPASQAPQQSVGQLQPPGPGAVKPQGPATSQNQQQQSQQPPQMSSPVKSISQEESAKTMDTVCVHIQGLPLLATPQDIRQFFSESQIALRGINIAHDNRGKPLGEGFVEFRGRADFDKALKKDKTSLGRHIVAVKPIGKKEMQARLGISHKTTEPSPSKAEEVKKDQTSGQALLATPIASNQNNSGQQQQSSTSGDPQPQNGAQQRMSQPQQPQQRPKPLMSSMVPGKGAEMQPGPGPGPSNKSIPPGVLNQSWFYVRCQNFPPDISISEILHFFQGFRPLGHSIRLHYSSDGKPTGNAVVGFAYREEAERALGNLNMKRCRQNIITLYPA
ncbi:hypothetical protein RRG08_038055 [Elysia crispata]|uniref:RRM domain-containing protein n=1 Tax=Elysia crispata TaxID=231223 RepID=A0AAE0ZZJ2_9GAST|nr:hypothetical protein RRG08_038055 [Elysia crispata]